MKGAKIIMLPLFFLSCQKDLKGKDYLITGVSDSVENLEKAITDSVGPFQAFVKLFLSRGLYEGEDFKMENEERNVILEFTEGGMKKLEDWKITVDELLIHFKQISEEKTGFEHFVFSRVKMKTEGKNSIKISSSPPLNSEDVKWAVKSILHFLILKKNNEPRGIFKIKEIGEKCVELERVNMSTDYINSIKIVVMENPEKVFSEFLKGNFHLIFPIPQIFLEFFKDVEEIAFNSYRIPYFIHFITFNPDRFSLLGDEIRGAILKGVDWREIIKNIYGEEKEDSIIPYEFNPSEAVKILERNGWQLKENKNIRERNGKKLRLIISFPSWWPSGRRLIFFVKNSLFKLGIEVHIKTLSTENFMQSLEQGNYGDLLLIMGNPGPRESSFSFWCYKTSSGYNPFSLKNRDFCLAVEKGNKNLLREMLLKYPPFIPLSSPPLTIAYTSQLFIPGEWARSFSFWRFIH